MAKSKDGVPAFVSPTGYLEGGIIQTVADTNPGIGLLQGLRGSTEFNDDRAGLAENIKRGIAYIRDRYRMG